MAYVALFQGRAAPAHLETMKAALIHLARQSRLEPGTIRYEFYQSADDPELFLLFGIWKDEAAWQMHVSGEVHEQYVASLPKGAWTDPPRQIRLEALGK